MQNVSGNQANPEVPINENFETLEWAAVYGLKQSTTTGLTWGYYGGRWGGFNITDGTVTLTGSNTNYIIVNRDTGAVSTSTSSTNWDDASLYSRLYKVVTGSSTITSWEDHRAGLNGALGYDMIPIVRETKAASGSNLDFTGIPSYVRRITVNFYNFSTNGTSPVIIQLGDSGGIEASNYDSSMGTINGATAARTTSTKGFLVPGDAQTEHRWGSVVITRQDGSANDRWIAQGNVHANSFIGMTAGHKTLSAILTQLRITTDNGTDTFDQGEVSILFG